MVHEGAGADIIESVQVPIEAFGNLGQGAVGLQGFDELPGGFCQGVILRRREKPGQFARFAHRKCLLDHWIKHVVQIKFVGGNHRIWKFAALDPGQNPSSVQPGVHLPLKLRDFFPGLIQAMFMIAVSHDVDDPWVPVVGLNEEEW